MAWPPAGRVVNSKKEVWYLPKSTLPRLHQADGGQADERGGVYKHFGGRRRQSHAKPEGMPLNLWAQTNDTVWFRSSAIPSPSNNILLN